jgi:uncharacterized protein involved in exopolysaccharide biosynthesis
MAIEEDVKSPQEYLDLMIRRKWRIMLPAVVIAGIAIAVALLVPPVYRSTAMVLIEEPEVPREFIRSTITSFAAERLQVIEKRVMTTQNLISVINKFDLYRDERRTTPIGDLGLQEGQEIIIGVNGKDGPGAGSSRSSSPSRWSRSRSSAGRR